jgi:hypothetical protein
MCRIRDDRQTTGHRMCVEYEEWLEESSAADNTGPTVADMRFLPTL